MLNSHQTLNIDCSATYKCVCKRIPYKIKTSGKCTDDAGYGYILDVEECEPAANYVNFDAFYGPSTSGYTSNSATWPYGCWIGAQSVYFRGGDIANTEDCSSSRKCLCKRIGATKCWGYGAHGQLGYGDGSDRGDGANEMGDDLPVVDVGTGRRAVALALGNEHSCAILDDGATKCWGSGSGGQLGYGDTSNRGDGANEMGDDLPVVDVGTGLSQVV
jgi:hypothetical protein